MWAKDEEKTMNYHLILKGDVVDLSDTALYITATYTYRLSVNGEFVAYGPARTAKGYARVDEISLDRFSGTPAEIVIEVSGYNCCSYVCTKQDSLVVAELRRGDDVVLTTADFKAYKSCRVVREADRYAGQRHFVEIYDERNGDLFDDINRVELTEVDIGIKYLPRHVLYPDYDLVTAKGCRHFGTFEPDPDIKESNMWEYRPESSWGAFEDEEIKLHPYDFVYRQKLTHRESDIALPLVLKAGEYAVFDLEKLYAGFLGWSLTAHSESDIIVAFSEMCFDNDFEFNDLGAKNAIEQLLPKEMNKETFSLESYTARFVAIFVKEGNITLNKISLRTYEHPAEGVKEYSGNDKDLATVYEAAIRSFVHNAVDLYTDCPSRERAGWLCDSYFSGKAEYELFGTHTVEDNYLENYTLFKNDGNLPEGALPMCYPAEYSKKEDGKFIPQWNLWYVLEVADHLLNRAPDADREKFRPSVLGVLNFFKSYENELGLVEKLPSWNFVEWSTANDWVHDVNYPTNFLYSEALMQTAKVFDLPELALHAERIRETAAKMSFDGELFCDHAVRNEKGELVNQPHVSEAAQYYAALFGGIDICDAKYEKLLAHIRSNFKNLDKSNIEFVPVNAFIGFYLRMEYLMRHGEKDLLEKDIKDFFSQTARHTHTLWEHKYRSGSYDHGFASYVTLAINYLEK